MIKNDYAAIFEFLGNSSKHSIIQKTTTKKGESANTENAVAGLTT